MANRSTIYTPAKLASMMPRFQASDARHGLIVDPDTGDLTNEAVYRSVLPTRRFVWEALGYLDVLDIDQQTLKGEVTALRQEVAVLKQELSAVRGEFTMVQQTLNAIVSFMGVIIPAWETREEVENGDDMGMVRMSAAQLGLQVNFIFDQLNPAFAHEQVEAIDPPAGTLVARGSTITITINLEG